jgi:antitoxin component of MazEF toxin-antitoxin module
MPIVFYKRKVIEIGDSLGITIPKDVAFTYDLKAGTYMTIIFDQESDDDYLVILDMKNRDRDELWKLMRS